MLLSWAFGNTLEHMVTPPTRDTQESLDFAVPFAVYRTETKQPVLFIEIRGDSCVKTASGQSTADVQIRRCYLNMLEQCTFTRIYQGDIQ